jgi:chemotaxis protein CheX
MSISEAELREIAAGIWSTQLGIELEETPVPAVVAAIGGEAMTGSVQIAGGWRGAVHLHCSRSAVERAAALMFGVAAERLSADDLRDALGELTNMTAGNVKACLGHDACISMPTVVEGRNYGVTVRGSEVLQEVGFLVEGDPLLVTLLVKRGGE